MYCQWTGARTQQQYGCLVWFVFGALALLLAGLDYLYKATLQVTQPYMVMPTDLVYLQPAYCEPTDLVYLQTAYCEPTDLVYLAGPCVVALRCRGYDSPQQLLALLVGTGVDCWSVLMVAVLLFLQPARWRLLAASELICLLAVAPACHSW